jgi:ankyrin repeat protein
LLEATIDVDRPNIDGRTPLSYAAGNGRDAILKLLLKQDGVDPNTKDNVGRTPLFYAIWNGHDEAISALLFNNKIDPDTKDCYGTSLLSIAVRHNREDTVKLLLATGRIDLDSIDYFGRTPLWYAERYGNAGIIKHLGQGGGYNVSLQDIKSPKWAAKFDISQVLCDICTMKIVEGDDYYRCQICNEGDFDICIECHNTGGRCLELSHELHKGCDKRLSNTEICDHCYDKQGRDKYYFEHGVI